MYFRTLSVHAFVSLKADKKGTIWITRKNIDKK